MSESTEIAAAPSAQRSNAELWCFTLDHERLARAWAAAGGLALVAGLVLALGLAFAPLAEGHPRRETLYTMHGLALVFLVVLTAIPGVIGNALLPGLLGTNAMAWPRANLLGFQIHLVGLACFAVALLAAPADAGWTFDVPYALRRDARLGWSLLGMVAVVSGGACSAANLVATIAFSPARTGSGWRMPLLAWSLGAGAVVQMLAAPVLVGACALLFAERAGASEVLGARTVAGDVRFASWFWAFAHPAIGAAALGCIGLVDHLLAAPEDRRDPALSTSVHALLALAVAVCASTGVHAIGGAGSAPGSATQSALILAAGVPFAMLVAGWLARSPIADGPPSAARCFGATAGLLLTFAALAGFLLALPAVGAFLAGTTFTTAPLHFAAVGIVAAVLGGLHDCAPRWFGRPARAGRGRAAAALLVVGALLAFGPAIARGLSGEPRRAFETGTAIQAWVAAGGSVLLVSALGLAAWNLIAAYLAGREEEGA